MGAIRKIVENQSEQTIRLKLRLKPASYNHNIGYVISRFLPGNCTHYCKGDYTWIHIPECSIAKIEQAIQNAVVEMYFDNEDEEE